VSPVVGEVVLDACTLWNFAVVGRLDLLDNRYSHRGVRWTESIQLEISRHVPEEPQLQDVLNAQWLGQPMVIAGSPQTLIRIERIRRGLLATPTDPPTLHLGEAEVIDLLETQHPSWVFITDDGPAGDLAKRRGLTVLDSARVLSECHAAGEIGCPAAYALLEAMAAKGRGVRIPPSHREVCP
jgi:predicted nucleic acid-binding protein